MYHLGAMARLPDETPHGHLPIHPSYVPRHMPSALERWIEKEAAEVAPATATPTDENKSADPPATQLYDDPDGEPRGEEDSSYSNRSDHTETPPQEENAVEFNQSTRDLAEDTRGGVVRRALSGVPSADAVQKAVVSSQLSCCARGDYETHSVQLQPGSRLMKQTKTASPFGPSLMSRVRNLTGRS